MTDSQIIENLRKNQHPAAVKHLYKILPAVKKYILANSGSVTDSDDIFQDALVILYRKSQDEQWLLTSSLKTYLMAIAKNCWQAELRQRAKAPVTNMPNEIPASDASEEESFITAKKAFSLLGEKCKELLIEFYYKKKSFQDIAASLGFNDEKTAKNQKYRCLQKAKEHYTSLSK